MAAGWLPSYTHHSCGPLLALSHSLSADTLVHIFDIISESLMWVVPPILSDTRCSPVLLLPIVSVSSPAAQTTGNPLAISEAATSSRLITPCTIDLFYRVLKYTPVHKPAAWQSIMEIPSAMLAGRN